MKVQLLSLIASVLSLTSAFSDTALFYSSANLEIPHKYITESNDISSIISQYTQELCSNQQQLYIYRVPQLKNGDVKQGLVLENVHYKSINEVTFPIDDSCTVETISSASEQSKANIVVVDVSDGLAHSIDEFLNHNNVIVQGVPSFIKNNKFKQVVDQVNVLFDHEHIEKRQIQGFIEDVEQEIEQEIEADFKEAEELVNDDTVIYNQRVNVRASNDTTTKHSGLFTNYQFFTPGIWSGIIVSFFLLTILYLGINWLNSLEVTYSSFEKQVDYDKKNE